MSLLHLTVGPKFHAVTVVPTHVVGLVECTEAERKQEPTGGKTHVFTVDGEEWIVNTPHCEMVTRLQRALGCD